MADPPEPSHTFTPRVLGVDHGETVFAVDYRHAFFRRNLRRPVLTAGTSALAVPAAFELAGERRAGEGLVAEAVNQLLEHGGEPVFACLTVWGFSPERERELIEGVVSGCREAGCALAAPRRIAAEEAGGAVTAVGVAEERKVVDSRRVEPGDVVLAIREEGFLPIDVSLGNIGDIAGKEAGRCLTRPVLAILRRYRRKFPIHAVLAPGSPAWRRTVQPETDVAKLLAPKLPDELVFKPEKPAEDTGELWRVEPRWEGDYRCGLGLLLVVGPYYVKSVKRQFKRLGIEAVTLGVIGRREETG